ncbi:putative acyl-CoA thioester hydrolase [gamma proteobacterium HTCC5015]|nr:putative acyl-CoA thioester hydrolase [gamma proteobacterium HTCC5015]
MTESTENIKPVSASKIDAHIYKVFPNDLNSHNTVFGGVIMGIADRLALVVAERHSGHTCVTVSVDDMHFLRAARGGDTLVFRSSTNRAWGSSMEIGVQVMAEDSYTGDTRHILSAYFTFVALDSDNKPTEVPQLQPETEEEELRYAAAGLRRSHRLESAKKLKALRDKGSDL